MISSTSFQWHSAGKARTRSVTPSVIAVVIILGGAVGLFLLREWWAASAMVILTFVAVPAFVTPTPRIEADDRGVELLPRRLLINTHFTFPVVIFFVSVLVTIQLVLDSPDPDVRLYFIVGLAWLGTVIGTVTAYRYWGPLQIDSKNVAVTGRSVIPIDRLIVNFIQQKNVVFPYLELTDGGGKKQLLFPVKFYGLEANSLYSVLRHLAETDAETRSSYSPELIREMLLFKPNGEVAVGDSIEVRVVAQPRATTS